MSHPDRIRIVLQEIGGDMSDSDEYRFVTYQEGATLLGIQPDSVRRRASSRKWPRRRGNDGLARVGIPVDVIPDATPDVTPAITPEDPDHIRIREELAAARERIEQVEIRLKEAQADRDHWRALAERLSEPRPDILDRLARIFRRRH